MSSSPGLWDEFKKSTVISCTIKQRAQLFIASFLETLFPSAEVLQFGGSFP
jgi:hypothetical protein